MYSIQDWLHLCFSTVDKDWKDHVTIDESFKPEYNILFSDPSTINSIGWTPKNNIAQLAKIMMESE